MSYDNIARAAEYHWDKLELAAEREQAMQQAREEAEAERAERDCNAALSIIRTHLAGDEDASKSFALQLLSTMDCTIADHFNKGPMDQIHEAIWTAIETLETQGVSA